MEGGRQSVDSGLDPPIDAHLPPTAQRIARTIEEQANDVIRMSITELAEQAQASEGSVVGLCRRLGIDGFQELKILLSRDLVDPVRLIQEDLREIRLRGGRSRARLRRPHRLAAADAPSCWPRRHSPGRQDHPRRAMRRGLRHRQLGADRPGPRLSPAAARPRRVKVVSDFRISRR